MTIPVEVRAGLEYYKVEPALCDLVERAAAVRSLTADPPGVGYVAVRPAAWGTVSAYFHTSYVDVALSPHLAEALHREHGWKLVKTNSTTGFLRIEGSALTTNQTIELAASLLISAVDKSEVGTAYEGGKGSKQEARQSAAMCPKCGVEMLGGHCDACD